MAIAVLVALPASAATTPVNSDRDKPITFAGDAGDAESAGPRRRAQRKRGDHAGSLSIRADRIVFKQNPDNSLSATAYGNPVAIRQKREGFDEYYEGYAQRIEYDGSNNLVELFDRALLKRGQDEIRSNYVSYNTSTEVFKAEGRASAVPDPTGPGTRVRGMFQPRTEATGKDKAKDGAKDSAKDGKDAAKATTPAASAPSVTLRSAGDLASPATK
jgi:lipopolysaccharide export system protein LptA